MATALAKNDLPAIEAAAHALKGSASYFGHNDFTSLVKGIEAAARQAALWTLSGADKRVANRAAGIPRSRPPTCGGAWEERLAHAASSPR